ncbi:MAG: radical SAM family heme chaperone HemW [Melioribacteraceae bacterium]|nr:radical SAM family heme chaperone HemW [Melioribacteraceae bacterium]
MKETAIYVHIPFCDHKCIYCDFYSIVSYDNLNNYLTALKNEIEFYASNERNNREIISIFFGGGTPSFVEPSYIGEIIESIQSNFQLKEKCEITLETNPGTVTKQKIEKFIEAGINRVSIGIQSFNEDELKFLTRIHDKETALKTVYNVKEAGIDNISIDLIFNLPKQTKEKWKSNLETAFKLPINHISAYSLILEKGTILNKMVLDGKVKLQDDDYDAELYEFTIDEMTKNNFMQYEVSNFAQEGFQCIHNKAYWDYKDYLSFGTSAHSFANGKRWWNVSSLKMYITMMNQKGNAVIGEEILSREQMLDEYIMLALRGSGLDLTELKNIFGTKWIEINKKYLDTLLLNNFVEEKNNLIKLTPKGYAICDEILLNFQ